VLRRGWQAAILDTDLRQIWRDHLLALSMREHEEWAEESKYVLVFPRRNTSFADAARRYAEHVNDADASFMALTVEDVVEAAFAHGGPKDAFIQRYVW